MSARILVVDDVPANVKLLEAPLSAEYFDVMTASNGAEALAERVDDLFRLVGRHDGIISALKHDQRHFEPIEMVQW